jgi:hypothetical protein
LKPKSFTFSGVFVEIPYSTEQGLLKPEQGLISEEQGICFEQQGNAFGFHSGNSAADEKALPARGLRMLDSGVLD